MANATIVFPTDIHDFVPPLERFFESWENKKTVFVEEEAMMQARQAGKRFVRLYGLVYDTITGEVAYCPYVTQLERLPNGWAKGYQAAA